ncbi:PspC domain-containing protein [Mumia zhuanghuii]|uniref:PspC domain-containing protein n=1 Tax=Mumia zhuanghuii TaxID=2585211 RepID=A0A5C4MBH3_9ACTN|nr:PspC domain-containing protein [Mumia zhuanghuii]TNC34370.1 PspC domain-containing protein [Mumia zhuanghuii]TNC35969.1 PspC domain-containing protein [Mumia zhuanghuii]
MTRSKKLVRTSSDQWIAGVCGGIARYLGVDPTVVRLAFVVLTVLGLGSMVVVYLVAWLLMPKDA